MPPRCVVAALVAWLSCYAPSLSCAQAVQDTGLPVQKDRVPDKNKPSPTDGQEGSGVLVLPVEFQSAPESGRHARALLGSSLLPLGGSIHGQGYYYATLHLGTPPRPFQVIIDTGSTMTYVPCSTCSHCGKHADPYFDLSSSSSSQTVSCSDHDRCYTKLCTGTSCSYTRHYAEDSISSGTIVSDLLSLPGPSVQSHPGDTSRNDSLASDLSQYRVAFGCEAKETGDIYTQNADGIMGIGRGAISIPAQLAAQGAMADVFALCYGDFDGGGSLVLGDVVPPDTIQYTPLKKQPLHPAYYQVEVLSASIGGSIVSVPARAYAVGYGAVFDSGTTFSYFPTIVFNALKHAIMEKVELDTVPGPDPRYHDLCYGDAGDESSLSSHFPNIVLEFAPMPGSASAKLTLSPMNYLFTHSRPGAYCLGIFDNGNAGTLLGKAEMEVPAYGTGITMVQLIAYAGAPQGGSFFETSL